MGKTIKGKRTQSLYGCFTFKNWVFYPAFNFRSGILILYFLHELVFVRLVHQHNYVAKNSIR